MNTNENDIIDLKKMYPDNKVQCLYRNEALYRRIYNHSKKRKQSIEDYLYDLGFTYTSGILHDEDDIEQSDYEKLISIYPDCKVINISKIPSLYEGIKYHAKKMDLTIDEYIEKLGFTMIYPIGNRHHIN
jgi:hypothetical protein